MKARKIVLSSLSSLFLLTTFATTTYAYVVIGNKADVREFNFNIENTTGLLLSLDGNNFSQDISSDMLAKAIAPNGNYDELKFTGVTVDSNNSKVLFNDNNEIKFVKDSVSNNKHEFESAVKNIDYISFDLYFKIVNSNEKNDYNLFITNNSYIKGKLESVKLSNSISTIDKEYHSGDTINVNTANALRTVVSLIDNDSINTNYYEITDNDDLGSSAIEGIIDDKHNPNKNAMYTYYNNCFPLYPFTKAAKDNESFNTKNSFEAEPLKSFIYDNTKKDYNIIHSKIYIYLEGWDSDYFLGLPESCNNLDIKLQFEVKEKNI